MGAYIGLLVLDSIGLQCHERLCERAAYMDVVVVMGYRLVQGGVRRRIEESVTVLVWRMWVLLANTKGSY